MTKHYALVSCIVHVPVDGVTLEELRDTVEAAVKELKLYDGKFTVNSVWKEKPDGSCELEPQFRVQE